MADPSLGDMVDSLRLPAFEPAASPNAPEDATGTYLDSVPKEEWSREDRLHHGLLKSARNNQRWDDIAPSLKQDFPEADPDRLKEHYKALVPHVHLEEARKNLSDKDETWRSYWGRHVLPGGSALMGMRQSQEYSDAQKRVKTDQARPEDYNTIAGYERIQEIDRNRGYGAKLGGSIAHIPAILGEFAAGGAALKGLGAVPGVVGRVGGSLFPETAAAAVKIPSLLTSAGLNEVAKQAGLGLVKSALVTPLVPAMYAKQWADGNMKAGREPMDPLGLPPAYAMGVLQVGVLGGIAKMAGTVGGAGIGAWTSRLIRGAETGLGGQEAVNIGASAVSELLPEAWKLDTGYGTIGLMVSGKKGEWAEHLSIQAITFAAFSSLHAHNDPNAGMAEMKRVQDALGELKAKGLAGDGLGRAYDTLAGLMKTNPDPTPEQVRKAMEALPEGPVRDFGMGMADKFHGEPPPPGDTVTLPDNVPHGPPVPEAPQQPDPYVNPNVNHERDTIDIPGLKTPQEKDDALSAQHLEATKAVNDARANEKAAKDLVAKGFPKKAEAKAATRARIDAENEQKRISKELEDHRAATIKAEADAKAAEPTGKPGNITSDLDQTTEALGMGKAVKEVPTEPEQRVSQNNTPVKEPQPAKTEMSPAEASFRSVFPEAQQGVGGLIKGKTATHTITMEPGSEPNAVKLDFYKNPVPGESYKQRMAKMTQVGARLEPGSLDVARKLRAMVKGLRESGAKIEYVTDGHAKIYEQALARLGYRQTEGPVEEGPKPVFRAWEPISKPAEATTAKVAEPAEKNVDEVPALTPEVPGLENAARDFVSRHGMKADEAIARTRAAVLKAGSAAAVDKAMPQDSPLHVFGRALARRIYQEQKPGTAESNQPAAEPVKEAEPAKTTVPDAEAEELTDRSAAGKAHLDEIFDAVHLSANERHILRERGLKRTLDDIAGDKELLKADGTPYKSGRSGMKAIEKRAMDKLRAKFPDLPEDFTMSQLTEAGAADEAAERIVKGHDYNPADVQIDPVELKAAKHRALSRREKADNKMTDLIARIEKETKDAGGKLPAERAAKLWAKLTRLSEIASGTQSEGDQESESEPGAEAGRGSVESASVRSEASPGVQGGDKAPGPTDAVQTAKPPAPAHPEDAAATGGEREAPRDKLTTRRVEDALRSNGKLPQDYKEWVADSQATDEFGSPLQEAIRFDLIRAGFDAKEVDAYLAENTAANKLIGTARTSRASEPLEVMAELSRSGTQSFEKLTDAQERSLAEAINAGLLKKVSRKDGSVAYQRTGDLRTWVDARNEAPGHVVEKPKSRGLKDKVVDFFGREEGSVPTSLEGWRFLRTGQRDSERVARVMKMRADGMSVTAIAKKEGVADSTIARDIQSTQSPEEIAKRTEQVKKLREQGLPVSEIGKRLGIDRRTVREDIARSDQPSVLPPSEPNTLPSAKQQKVQEQIEEAVKLRDQGLTISKSAERMGIDRNKVAAYLDKRAHLEEWNANKVPDYLAKAIDAAELDGKQSRAIKALLQAGTFRNAAELLKSRGEAVSHESVRTRANEGFKILQDVDPDTFENMAIGKSGFEANKADRVAGVVGKQGAAEIQGEEGAYTTSKEYTSALKAFDEFSQRQDAELSGEDPHGVTDEFVDHVLKHPEALQELKGIKDDLESAARESGLSTEEGRHYVNSLLSEAIARRQLAFQDQGGEGKGQGNAISRFLADEAGSLNLDKVGEWFKTAYERLSSSVQHVRDNLAEFAGQMGPRMTRADRPSGEAMARFNAAPGFAREAAPRLITKVMGDDATPEGRKLAGAVITERRLRYMKEAFTKQGDQEAAGAVKTIVGQPGSPLANEADYQQALASPKMQAILDRWKQFMVPVMNDNYQRAEGLADTDPIESKTQIPDEPVNLKGLRSTDPQGDSVVKAGGGRGNLKNPKLGKLIFARKATGASDAYDVDLGAIIENSLQRSTSLAAKAEWFRTMTENGVAQFGKPGAQVEGYREIPGVKPPKGTQAADPGETSLYVKDDVYGETRQALAVDEAARFPVIKGINDVLTKAALMSTVEGIYHGKNLLTMLVKPGMRLRDAITNSIGLYSKNPELADRMVELARIGAMKTEGSIEGGEQYSKYNPLGYVSKALDGLQRVMRLTAEDAFDRLQRSGRVEGTETNKRDFINQLGQYNRSAQNKLIVLLRDTGLGPFATAGSNYYMQGLRTLTGNAGVKGANARADLLLRAEMLARTFSVVAVAGLTNFLLHKRIDGDDNTPMGAIKTGEKDGKTKYIDITNLTGNLTRGMRETGLLALAEGVRKGDSASKTVDRATENAIHALIHPAMGPGPSFAHTLATGKNSIGMNVAPKADKEASQAVQNLKAALMNANPFIATATGADRPKDELTGDRFLRLLGPYAPHERGPAKTPRTPHEWRQRTADILRKK